VPAVRIFVAIELPSTVLDALEEMQSRLRHGKGGRAGRWVARDNIHLTLKFLGSVTAKGEGGQAFDPFEITFTPTGLDYVAVSGPEVEAMWNE